MELGGQYHWNIHISNINSNNKDVIPVDSNTRPVTEEYVFDYFDDIGSGPLFESTGQTINTYKDYKTEYDKFGVNLSALGGSEGKSSSFSGGATIGLVLPFSWPTWVPFSKAGTLGGNFGGGSSNAETKTMMADIDGDGLPDKIFKDGGDFFYRKNLGDSFSTEIYPINNLPNLNYSRNKSSDKLFTVNILVGNLTRSNSKSSSTISTYMTDVNADGLLDVVDNERVYFGYINPQTQVPSYSLDSSITPVTILKEESVAPVLNPEPQVDLTNGPMDMVMVWRAPKPGQVKVSGVISKQHIALESGVKFSIERLKENDEGSATFVLGPNLMLSTQESHNHTLTVEKGELLFFRVHTNQIPLEELGVAWNPKVEYTGVNPDPVLAFSRHTSSYKEGFIVGSHMEHPFYEKGKYRLEWPTFSINEKDRVTIRVSYYKKGNSLDGNLPAQGNNVVIYEKVSNITQSTSYPSPNMILDMSSITELPNSYHFIKVDVLSDSEINWKAIDDNFKPRLVSLDSNNNDVYLTPYYSNYSKVHTNNNPLEYTTNGPTVSVTINHNFKLSGCTSNVCNNRYVYLVVRASNGNIHTKTVGTSIESYYKFRYKLDASGNVIQK